MQSRLGRLRLGMLERGLDAVLISCEVNQGWACGFDFTDGYLLIFEDKAYLITDPRYIEAAKKEVGAEFECILGTSNMSECFNSLLSEQGVGVLGIEDREMSLYSAETLKSSLDGIKIVGVDMLFDELRACKDAEEIAKIKEAQRITDAAFSHILGYIREGVSEIDIAVELEFFMRKMGASAPSFDFIVASGRTSSMPHAQPRKRAIEKGFLTLDFGCVYGGYCSDMTRTVSVGKASEEMKRLYSTVLRAQENAIAFISEGVLCTEADKAAREICDREYKGLFLHSLGHGVGRRIHELPRLSEKSGLRRLSEGNVVTVEPGIYIEGFCGVRIEDMLIIGKNSADDITKSSKELLEL